jgi:hypothetical protein
MAENQCKSACGKYESVYGNLIEINGKIDSPISIKNIVRGIKKLSYQPFTANFLTRVLLPDSS